MRARMERRTAVVIDKRWTGREYLYSYLWYLIGRYGGNYFEITPKDDPVGFRVASGYYKIVLERCPDEGEWHSKLQFQNGATIINGRDVYWIKLAKKFYVCE